MKPGNFFTVPNADELCHFLEIQSLIFAFSISRAFLTDSGSRGLLFLKSKWCAPWSIMTMTTLGEGFTSTPRPDHGSKLPLLKQRKQVFDTEN